MAHTICRDVTWEHSKLGGNPDGTSSNCKFHVDDHPDAGDVPITGRHYGRGNASLQFGRCDGNSITFAVEDPTNQRLISYLNGKYSSDAGKDFIKGKFTTLEVVEAPIDSGDVNIEAFAPDDWEADKIT